MWSICPKGKGRVLYRALDWVPSVKLYVCVYHREIETNHNIQESVKAEEEEVELTNKS